MKKKFYPNGKLNAIFTSEENNNLLNRIKAIKPTFDLSCPKTLEILTKKPSKPSTKPQFCKLFFKHKI